MVQHNPYKKKKKKSQETDLLKHSRGGADVDAQ